MSDQINLQQRLNQTLTTAANNTSAGTVGVSTARESGSVGSSAAPSLPTSAVAEKVASETTDDEKKELESAVDSLNQVAAHFDRKLSFSVDDESGRTVITVTDPDTEEIIRQIPPENALKMSANLKEMVEPDEAAAGLLLSDQA